MNSHTGERQAIDVAPLPDLARGMFLLFQSLILMRNYGLAAGRKEAEVCRHLADTLLPLPDGLLRYRAFNPSGFWRNARERRSHIPAGYAEAWESVFRSAEELPSDQLLSWQLRWGAPAPPDAGGMGALRRLFRSRARTDGRSDAHEINLAPDPELARYLGLIRDGLHAIRDLALPRSREEAVFCGYVADALHNLPDLLLRFGEFDEQEFWRYVGSCRAQIAPTLVERWDAIFDKARPVRASD